MFTFHGETIEFILQCKNSTANTKATALLLDPHEAVVSTVSWLEVVSTGTLVVSVASAGEVLVSSEALVVSDAVVSGEVRVESGGVVIESDNVVFVPSVSDAVVSSTEVDVVIATVAAVDVVVTTS